MRDAERIHLENAKFQGTVIETLKNINKELGQLRTDFNNYKKTLNSRISDLEEKYAKLWFKVKIVSFALLGLSPIYIKESRDVLIELLLGSL